MSQYNKYSAACPDETELIAYKNGTLPEQDKELLTEHLILCDYCLLTLDLLPSENLEYVSVEGSSGSDTELIPTILRKAVEDYQKQLSAEPKSKPKLLQDLLANNEELKAGQIWRTKLENIIFPSNKGTETFSVSQLGSVPHLVAITNPFIENLWTKGNEKYQIIKVVPISDNIEYAAEGDMIFNEAESPLGYSFMLQLWNEQQMIMNNLDACLGEIDITPELFKSVPKNETTSLTNFLTNRGKQQVSEETSDFSFFGIIKNVNYSNPKMRFRAMEFENTAYLRDPVLELRESLNFVEGTEKSKTNFWEPVISKIFELSRVFTPAYTAADPRGNSAEIERENFFNGKLFLEAELNSDGECEIVFQTSDSEFENKFLPLFEPIKMLVLLSEEATIPNHQVSILKIGKEYRNEKVIPMEKLMDFQKLSEMFENGEITDEIIKNSVSHVATESGLQAWRKVAQREGINKGLGKIILEAVGD